MDAREILLCLAHPDTDRETAETLMAQLDGRETDGVMEAFRWLHDAADEAELHAAVMLLARWAERPVAAALSPALRALLAEPGPADLNKLAAADLLVRYGQSVARSDILAHVRDPSALARAALRTALAEAARDPLTLVRFLDTLADQPQDLVIALIEDLVAVEDAAAVAMLAPLAQTSDADIAVSAVAAIDELGLADAAAALALVAASHPDATVRQEADQTMSRLPPAMPRQSAGRPVQVWLAATDGGGQYVVVASPGEEGATQGVLTLYHTPAAGVVRYGTLELVTAEELVALLHQLADAGHPAAPASLGLAAWHLEAAAARTLLAGGATAVGYAAWPWILGPVSPERPAGPA